MESLLEDTLGDFSEETSSRESHLHPSLIHVEYLTNALSNRAGVSDAAESSLTAVPCSSDSKAPVSDHNPKLPPRKTKPPQSKQQSPLAAMHSTTPVTTAKETNSGSKVMDEMPSDVKDLAQQLMMLMQESGLMDDGKDTPASDHAASTSATQNNSTTSPPKASEFKFKSPSLASLAQQTKKTVASQSSYSIGTAKSPQSKSSSNNNKDLFGGLGSILESLVAPGGGGGGEGGGGMNGMVDFILKNLLSKEVLYGPLVEIRDKYPIWLDVQRQGHLSPPPVSWSGSSGQGGLVSKEELARYEKQYDSIKEVCRQYETAPEDFAKIMESIQGMQAYGDPPSEIVSDMTKELPPGFSSSSQSNEEPDEPCGEGQDHFDFKGLLGEGFDPKDKCPVQ